jgi:outer membrane protein assembly factor BamB
MNEKQGRRRFIQIGLTGMVSVAAGCTGDSDDESADDGGLANPDTSTATDRPTTTTTKSGGKQESESDWPQLHFDLFNTGYNPEGTGPKDEIREKWRFQLQKSPREGSGSPVLTGDALYLSTEGSFHAISTTGEEIWSNSLGVGHFTPVVSSDLVIMAHEGTVYAFSQSDGSEVWKHEGGYTSPTLVGDSVFVKDDAIYELSVSNGAQKSRYEMPDGAHVDKNVTEGNPIITDESIYAFYDYEDGVHLTKISREDGEQVWRKNYETSAGTFISRLVLVQDKLYFAVVKIGEGRTLNAIRKSDGKLVWQSDFLYSEVTPSIAGSAIFMNGEKSVAKFNRIDGEKAWSYQTEAKPLCSPAIVDDMLYFGDNDGCIYGIDSTGEEYWKYSTSERINYIIVSNGVVYAYSNKGTIFALSE